MRSLLMSKNTYEIIIIGGGPSGLTAGLYASRAGIKTLLIEKMGCGGQSLITDWIENYPGFPDGISGIELAEKIEKQARKFNLEIAFEQVTQLKDIEREKDKIVLTAEKEYKTSAIIISTGVNHKTLNIPGEQQFRGKGVSYCATCDGPFFGEKDVFVVGGGNSAVQEAVYLTRFAKSVTIVHRRDRLRAVKILQDKAKANPKIKFMLSSVVEKISGTDKVEKIEVKNLITGKEETVLCGGLFVFAGIEPNTVFIGKQIELDEQGYVVVGSDMKTSVPGIFACGDVTRKLLRQVVTAVGEGALAAFSAQEYVEELKGTIYR